ncbi:hypothetical protein [Psychrobium sp. 1_MG-2023]|uniref:hypothetical protein n=1 Tax=Psychrobium sp. 1_MG-2023 TaxID=3062624 RepID=UPI000C31F7C7|nr:hypothetical protein [Psychrobium sp. 1_MG-2023]MDP2560974.1 hypothetical protein [Psychrobium sp. 1_MG-2023]PKF54950.1 hypothetical protein CW748_14875 [Alteromonadales bacterium alter-6D02]
MLKLFALMLFLVTGASQAITLENDVFSLKAKEIHFESDTITAKFRVTLTLKAPNAIAALASKNNRALSRMLQKHRNLQLSLDQDWTLEGHIQAITINGHSAIIEANELYLYSNKLLLSQLNQL